MTSALSQNLRPLSAPVKSAAQQVRAVGLAIGNFFYGDDIRTRRSLTFAYLSIMIYALSVINLDQYTYCGL